MQQLLDNYAAVFLAGILGTLLVLTAILATRFLAPFSRSPGKSVVFLAAILGALLVLVAILASRFLAPFSRSPGKGTPYECGMLPIGRVRTQMQVRYYLFAILFLIFDVEAVFIFPWAVTFVGVGQAAFYEMVLFIGILFAGLVYAWKKGVLQWR